MTLDDATNQSPREPKTELGELRLGAEALLEDFRLARIEHNKNQALSPIAGELANRFLNLQATKVEKALAPPPWRDSPQHLGLERRFKKLSQQASDFLGSVAKRTARGYRRDLTGSLRLVAQAARLETKITKLLGALEMHEMDELVYIEDVPKAPRSVGRGHRKRHSRRDALLATETTALAWVSVFVTTAAGTSAGFYFALPPSLGLLAIPAGVGLAALLTLALFVTRNLWVPKFQRT